MKKMKAVILCLFTIFFHVSISSVKILWGEKYQEVNTVASSETAKPSSNPRRLRASITRGSDEDTMTWEDCLNNLIYASIYIPEIDASPNPQEKIIAISRQTMNLSEQQGALLKNGMALLNDAGQEYKDLSYIESRPPVSGYKEGDKLPEKVIKQWEADIHKKENSIAKAKNKLIDNIRKIQNAFSNEQKYQLWDWASKKFSEGVLAQDARRKNKTKKGSK